MKDHCIRKYCAALKLAMSKTKKTEESRCAANPACSSECKLQTGPPPPEPVSRGSSATAKHVAPALSQAKAASEKQSAQLLQQAAGRVPSSADKVDDAPAATTEAPSAAAAAPAPIAAAAAEGNAVDAGRHGRLFRPPGGAPAAAKENGEKQLPGLDEACTRCPELGVGPAPEKPEETEDQREERLQSEAAGLFRSVVQEATGNQVTILFVVLLGVLKELLFGSCQDAGLTLA